MPSSTPESTAETAAAELAVPNTPSTMQNTPLGMFVFCAVLISDDCSVYVHSVDVSLFIRLSTLQMQL